MQRQKNKVVDTRHGYFVDIKSLTVKTIYELQRLLLTAKTGEGKPGDYFIPYYLGKDWPRLRACLRLRDLQCTINKPIDKEYFEAYADGKGYRKTFKSFWHTNLTDKQARKYLPKNIKHPVFLDIGAADGSTLIEMQKLGYNPFGIEVCPDIVFAGWESDSYLENRLVVGDAIVDLYQYLDNQFDVVYTTAFAYLPIKVVPLVMKEIFRITKHVFINIPQFDDLQIVGDTYRCTTGSSDWWLAQAKDAGFKPINRKIYIKER